MATFPCDGAQPSTMGTPACRRSAGQPVGHGCGGRGLSPARGRRERTRIARSRCAYARAWPQGKTNFAARDSQNRSNRPAPGRRCLFLCAPLRGPDNGRWRSHESQGRQCGESHTTPGHRGEGDQSFDPSERRGHDRGSWSLCAGQNRGSIAVHGAKHRHQPAHGDCASARDAAGRAFGRGPSSMGRVNGPRQNPVGRRASLPLAQG